MFAKQSVYSDVWKSMILCSEKWNFNDMWDYPWVWALVIRPQKFMTVLWFNTKQENYVFSQTHAKVGSRLTQNWRSCQPQARRDVACKRPWWVSPQAAVGAARAESPRGAAGRWGQDSPACADVHSALMLLPSATREGTQLQKERTLEVKHDYKYFLFIRQSMEDV